MSFDKSLIYKLLFDIKATKNLKDVLEKLVINTKIKFILKEILEISKKKFRDVIIDSIK